MNIFNILIKFAIFLLQIDYTFNCNFLINRVLKLLELFNVNFKVQNITAEDILPQVGNKRIWMLWGESKGKWKIGSLPGFEPRTPLVWTTSHNSLTTTNHSWCQTSTGLVQSFMEYQNGYRSFSRLTVRHDVKLLQPLMNLPLNWSPSLIQAFHTPTTNSGHLQALSSLT